MGNSPLTASRREFIHLARLAAIAGVGMSLWGLEPAAANAAPLIRTDADIDRLLPDVTNWGRWGATDQLGTLNYITPALRLKAAALIKTGRVISLARQVSVINTPGIKQGMYKMLPFESGSMDFIGMIYHGFGMTHLDALCHFFTPDGKMYNGFSVAELTPQGANKLGVEAMATEGIVGRGVLLDIAAVKGAVLAPGASIYPDDLEAAEKAQQVTVGAGDLLLVRTGAGPLNTLERRAGLHPQCLPWLHKRKVALLGGDGDNDAYPTEFKRWENPLHKVAIPYMGLPLLDNAELDVLSRVCREEKSWQFLLTIAPWRLQGTTSSPINPLAMF